MPFSKNVNTKKLENSYQWWECNNSIVVHENVWLFFVWIKILKW